MAGSVGGGGEFDVHLNLVPLIDILTNILFFLMVGFAAQEIAYETQAGVKLPTAQSNAELRTSISITLSASDLLVEKVRVAKVKDGKVDAPTEDDKIVPLYEKLNALRAERQAETHGVSESDDVVLLVADRGIPFSLLSPIMKTAAMAGFPNFRFAVVKK